APYRLCIYEHNELTQGNADADSIELFGGGDDELGRRKAIESFIEHYHEARREAEGVLDAGEADAALAVAIQALEPSAEQWHTGGGCYAVTAATPDGLFITVATAFPPAVFTYSQGSVEAYDLGDDTIGAWDFEQAVAGTIDEDSTEFTQARIDAFAADFAEQFAWASELEKPEPNEPQPAAQDVTEFGPQSLVAVANAPDGCYDAVRQEARAEVLARLELLRPATSSNRESVAIAAELEKLGWDLVAEAHEPCDEPFWTVIAKRRRPVFPAAPYVVCSFDYSGISNGHYDLDRERAFRVFADKVASREEV
ncbi:MAG TPA: hypothetical protein VMW48_05235, partial [Vicinamibacterales bacterium]|nr:hypothetical protein [Vicinamibacterales bacterium]